MVAVQYRSYCDLSIPLSPSGTMHHMFSRYSRKTSARLANFYVPVPPSTSRNFLYSTLRSTDCIDEESLSGYKPGRYCPITLGGTLGQSYVAMVKLGYGRTSTSWLCKDSKYGAYQSGVRISPLTLPGVPTKFSRLAQPMPLTERRRHSRESGCLLRAQSTLAASAYANQNASSIFIFEDKLIIALSSSLWDQTCSNSATSNRTLALDHRTFV